MAGALHPWRCRWRLVFHSVLSATFPKPLGTKLSLTSGCCYLLTWAFYDCGCHDFELPELSLQLELCLQELALLVLASVVLLLQGAEPGLQLLVLWRGGGREDRHSPDRLGSLPDADMVGSSQSSPVWFLL